jgi:hypothetical protein
MEIFPSEVIFFWDIRHDEFCVLLAHIKVRLMQILHMRWQLMQPLFAGELPLFLCPVPSSWFRGDVARPFVLTPDWSGTKGLDESPVSY